MTANLLTVKAIAAGLKKAAADGSPLTLVDGEGLSMIARPDGAGWWRLRYWLNGRENRLSLGVYPTVGLADARARRNDARKLIAGGIDPSEHRKAGKQVQIARAATARAVAMGQVLPGSFEAVAREWWTTVHISKVSEKHAARTLIRFTQDVFPWLGARPLDGIEAPELLTVLRRVEARGAIETAHRIKDACAQVFRYGIAAGHCARNPAADIRDALKPVPTRHHAAITDPKRAGELLRDMVGYEGHTVTRAALALSAMLLLRPGELRQLEWAWVDLEGATVTIPGDLMKRKKEDKVNGVPHLVPLPPQAVALLRDELQPLTGGGRYLFPGQLKADRPMSDNTVRSALRRLGYGNDDMTAHGFRAMARTMIAERLNIAPEIIEAQLAHAVTDTNGRAYNRTQYLDQRREMMGQWANYLDRLRSGADVVPLKRVA